METRSTKVVALFDILGTKKRLETVGIDPVLSDYRKLASFVEKLTGCLVIRPVPSGDGGFCPAVGYLEVQQAYFSDTFVIWANYEAFRMPAFFDMCCQLFCHALRSGISLRGGVGVGDAHMDKTRSIYIGPALMDAALAEWAGLWLGISCGVSFNQEKFRGPFDPRTVLSYSKHQNPEKKTKYTLPGLVLDWPRQWRTSQQDDPRLLLARMNTDPEFETYYEHAKSFVDFSVDNHDWFLRQESLKQGGEDVPANGSHLFRSV